MSPLQTMVPGPTIFKRRQVAPSSYKVEPTYGRVAVRRHQQSSVSLPATALSSERPASSSNTDSTTQLKLQVAYLPLQPSASDGCNCLFNRIRNVGGRPSRSRGRDVRILLKDHQSMTIEGQLTCRFQQQRRTHHNDIPLPSGRRTLTTSRLYVPLIRAILARG